MMLSNEAHCKVVHSCSNSTRLSGKGYPMINSPVLVSCCDQTLDKNQLKEGFI